jgi:hypothetical protein
MIDDDFQLTIRETFGLLLDDDYKYSAEAFSMTLSEAHEALKSRKYYYYYYWYFLNEEQLKVRSQTPIPSIAFLSQASSADISAYTTIFASTTDTTKALTSFICNAKKPSPREAEAHYLSSRHLFPSTLKIPKLKNPYPNPYYDIWAWSCHEASFLGPLNLPAYAQPSSARITHPMLPVLYHHFRCVCPSFEALSVIAQLVKPTKAEGVVNMASGNGYWTFLLRMGSGSMRWII